MSGPLTAAEVRDLPALIEASTVATALSVSPSHVYRAVAAGEFPIQPIRLGRLLRFRQIDLLTLLGLVEEVGDEEW